MSDANDPLTAVRRRGIEGILDRLFLREEINGAGRCPTYLIRWTVFQPKRQRSFWRGFGIYLHKFIGDDWSLDLHDHPKRFVSIGIAGSYYEGTPTTDSFAPGMLHFARDPQGGATWQEGVKWQKFTAPWLRTFPADHIHRIELAEGRRPCWTCVVVLRHVREWGFWNGGRFIGWREYVQKDNAVADARKSCI